MNIVYLNSSPRGSRSISVPFVKSLLNEIGNFGIKYAISNVYLSELNNIVFHSGDDSDFKLGKTLYDDDMLIIEKELKNSDLIIVSVPVYAGMINAQMKNVIDRLSYWSHVYELIGKKTILIVTASCNSTENSLDYLEDFFTYLGTYVVDKVSVFDKPLFSEEYVEKRCKLCMEKLKLTINNDIMFSEKSESNFLQMKKYILSQGSDSVEYKNWDNRGLLRYASLKDAFLSKVIDIKY